MIFSNSYVLQKAHDFFLILSHNIFETCSFNKPCHKKNEEIALKQCFISRSVRTQETKKKL